ncbi:MAG TPA: hypothetical protein QGF41_00770 [Gammaproteobacteria bacterium]|jgi:hypothetical protein|nr:hypothetical protein [Gammaproteobacteria bacterium]|tara:strand:- start:2186 stop:2383 length:198 start_codon:yes stop_codon:yes gene_type:complete
MGQIYLPALNREMAGVGEGKESSPICDAVSRNQLIDSLAFIDEIKMKVGLRIENRWRGRPPCSLK